VAEDEVVDQVYAEKNATQNKGRTHQEIHGSTPDNGCIGVSINPEYAENVNRGSMRGWVQANLPARRRVSEFRYLG
jgi:hypothetical protein